VDGAAAGRDLPAGTCLEAEEEGVEAGVEALAAVVGPGVGAVSGHAGKRLEGSEAWPSCHAGNRRYLPSSPFKWPSSRSTHFLLHRRSSFRRPACGDSSQDGAARSHLHGGDTPGVEHHKPVTVPAAQYALIFRESRDDVFYDLLRSASILVVGDIQVLAANKAYAQNDLRHGHEP